MKVYHCRNIKAEADKLYISHQGLSRVIRSMEQELGQALFIRSNRGIEPTDFAITLLPHIQALLDGYERISGVRTLAGQKRSVVTVYALDHVLGYLGADFLCQFNRSYPDITLSVVDTTDRHALDMLASGKADFALTCHPANSDCFQEDRLFYSRFCFRIHRDDPLAEKSFLKIEDFRDRRIIGKGREYDCFRKNIDKLVLAERIDIALPLETSDEALIMELAERNFAIAVTYDFSAKKYCGDNCVIRYLEDESYGEHICLVQRKNSLPTMAGRSFRTFLLDWMGKIQ